MESPRTHHPLTGTIFIVATLLGWTSIPLFLYHFADLIDPWTSNGWRYACAAVMWAPVLLWGAWRRSLPKGLFTAAIVPSAINAIAQVCFTVAHYKIEPGLLTFGLRSQMVFVTVGAFLLFPNERGVIRSRSYLVGLLALMIGTGVAILMSDDPIEFGHLAGIALALASGMLFAAYGLAVRKYMRGMGSILSFSVISQYTAMAMIVLMLLLGDRAGLTALELGGSKFGLLMLSAVIGIAMGHVLYYASIERLGVAISSGVLQLHPFCVAVASYFIFGEVLTPLQWTGGLIALAGAGLMLRAQRKMKEPAREPCLSSRPSPR